MDIRALHRQGFTYAEIGRLVGRDWRTVKRYLVEGAQPVYRRKRAPSKLDELKPLVDQWLAREPRLRATRGPRRLVNAPLGVGQTGAYTLDQLSPRLTGSAARRPAGGPQDVDGTALIGELRRRRRHRRGTARRRQRSGRGAPHAPDVRNRVARRGVRS